MLSDVIALVRGLARSLAARTSPTQLALGFTLGVIIGVMPKTNLITLALCVVLFSLRCNKGLGLAAAVAFSFLGHSIDPFTHKVGLAVLSIHSLQATYAWALNMPLGPWVGFNNTVVLGTLLLGLYVAYPVFWLSRMFFSIIRSLWVREAYEPPVDEEDLQLGVAA
jgi:uncharacterized protein (TIGR03546 family)